MTPFWTKPSDHVMFHGPAPVNATDSVVLSPAHRFAPPVRVAPAEALVVLRVKDPVAGAPMPSVT
ncbi:MAG: hypothetical protein DIJKHBIC_04763 [Thermoanaerobaculia bacterium]|nr:hypothetical protein [Thermoanaerobaculia bacterium]